MPPQDVEKLPLLRVEELENIESVSQELFDVLRTRSYHRLARVPGVRSVAALPREPLNWYKLLTGKEQLFSSTALNGVYRALYLGRDLSLLDDLLFRAHHTLGPGDE